MPAPPLKPPSSASTARKGPTAATELRVEEIAQTIRTGTYKHGVTLPAFREKWGLCEQRIGELSTLAHKKVREELAADHDRIRAKGFAMLEQIADEAITGCDPKSGNNAAHLGVAIKAVDTWLTKSGAVVTTQKVTVSSDLASLTDEQLEARKQEIIARLTKKPEGGE